MRTPTTIWITTALSLSLVACENIPDVTRAASRATAAVSGLASMTNHASTQLRADGLAPGARPGGLIGGAPLSPSVTPVSPPPGGNRPDEAIDAPGKCNQFIATFCDKAITCGFTSKDECVAIVAKELDCKLATSVSTTFQSCLSDIGKMACEADDLPPSCDNVIKLGSDQPPPPPSGDGPAKCEGLLKAVCTKLVSCGDIAVTDAQCLAELSKEVDCASVTAVAPTYDRCLSAISANACPITNLPADCNGVLSGNPGSTPTTPTTPPPPPPPATEAAAKCQTLAKTVCDRFVSCGDMPSQAACTSELVQALECEKVVSVSSNFDACVAALPKLACPVTIPEICNRVLDHGQTPTAPPPPAVLDPTAPKKCDALVEAVCKRFESCGDGTAAACVTEAKAAIDCAKANAVSPNFDKCIADIGAAVCPVELPESCNGVLKIAD